MKSAKNVSFCKVLQAVCKTLQGGLILLTKGLQPWYNRVTENKRLQNKAKKTSAREMISKVASVIHTENQHNIDF